MVLAGNMSLKFYTRIPPARRPTDGAAHLGAARAVV